MNNIYLFKRKVSTFYPIFSIFIFGDTKKVYHKHYRTTVLLFNEYILKKSIEDNSIDIPSGYKISSLSAEIDYSTIKGYKFWLSEYNLNNFTTELKNCDLDLIRLLNG